MLSTLENIFFCVVMISLIVIFSLAIICLCGWVVIMFIDSLKAHFKDGKGEGE